MRKQEPLLMITCEHASNALPAFSDLDIPQDVLASHRGYDIGALAIFRQLVETFKPDFSCEGKFSRLYVDLNRSLRNNKNASPEGIAYHEEYWGKVEKFVEENLKSAAIIHLAIHSFTPVMNGVERNADIGILYDPTRFAERTFADVIVNEIHRTTPHLKVRRNYPYQGKTDGLCTALRKKFDPKKVGCYVGFEIEINQKLLK